MLDVDMSILAANTKKYTKYAKDVAKEYRSVYTLEQYRNGRLSFLRGLNPRDIFNNKFMQNLVDKVENNIRYEIYLLENDYIE